MGDAEQADGIDPERVLWGPATDDSSRLRLFGCECCRRVWSLLPEASRAAVEVRERFERFDRNEASEAECEAAREAARAARREARTSASAAAEDDQSPQSAGAWAAGAASLACSGNWVAAAKLAAQAAACASGEHAAGYRRERIAQCKLFSELSQPSGPSGAPDGRWLTADVVALARGIAADRAFERLPILADALMDAGCANAAVLAHCRQVKSVGDSSWVVDLLLTLAGGRRTSAAPDRGG